MINRKEKMKRKMNEKQQNGELNTLHSRHYGIAMRNAKSQAQFTADGLESKTFKPNPSTNMTTEIVNGKLTLHIVITSGFL